VNQNKTFFRKRKNASIFRVSEAAPCGNLTPENRMDLDHPHQRVKRWPWRYFRPQEGALGPKKPISFQGRTVQAQQVDFESKTPEAWNNYQLEDGSTIKVKLIMLNVIRLLDEYGPTGEPVYQFQAQQIVSVTSPDELMRKPTVAQSPVGTKKAN
jgi:hypothetical protein